MLTTLALAEVSKYDPNEARNEKGQWTTSGGASLGSGNILNPEGTGYAKSINFGNLQGSDLSLMKQAIKAGLKLFGTHASGLVIDTTSVVRGGLQKFYGGPIESAASGGMGKSFGTFDYIFFPSTGRGLDVSDESIDPAKHADIDGKIYVAGGEDGGGVFILTLPKNFKPDKPLKVEEPAESGYSLSRFRTKELLKPYGFKPLPDHTFTIPGTSLTLYVSSTGDLNVSDSTQGTGRTLTHMNSSRVKDFLSRYFSPSGKLLVSPSKIASLPRS